MQIETFIILIKSEVKFYVKKFTGDFETAVWKAFYMLDYFSGEIGKEENLQIGNSIDTFIEFCKNETNPEVYFHNLKFDGEFIIYWCLTHGFEHVNKKEDIKENTFTTLISDMRSVLYNNYIF